MQEIEKISIKVGRDKEQILNIVETYSKDSISFHDFIEDINRSYSEDKKISLLKLMWQTAYADGKLDAKSALNAEPVYVRNKVTHGESRG